jgi:hypothetical protein
VVLNDVKASEQVFRRVRNLASVEIAIFTKLKKVVEPALGLFFVDAVWNRPRVASMVLAIRRAVFVLFLVGFPLRVGWFHSRSSGR